MRKLLYLMTLMATNMCIPAARADIFADHQLAMVEAIKEDNARRMQIILQRGFVDILDVVEAVAPGNNSDRGLTYLGVAAFRCKPGALGFLLNEGADPNDGGPRGTPPLITTSFCNGPVGRLLFESLLAARADPNIRHTVRRTADIYPTALFAIMRSCNGALGRARLLIEAGADVNLKNSSGQTIFHMAAWSPAAGQPSAIPQSCFDHLDDVLKAAAANIDWSVTVDAASRVERAGPRVGQRAVDIAARCGDHWAQYRVKVLALFRAYGAPEPAIPLGRTCIP